ncbi:MAG: hypothetical protein WCD79_02380 [Chthoniobacteraceae bacterium]
MPDETKETKKKPGSWSVVRKHLATWDKAALIGLVKDIYEAAGTNRDFIQARCNAEEGDVSLANYKKRVVDQFYPARGEAKLKLGEARKAIREYHKATGNIPGTIELLLTFSEAGAKFTNDFGDIDDRFYGSLCSAMDELADLIISEGEEAWGAVSTRMEKLANSTNGIGWGYGDYVGDVFVELCQHFSSPV